MARLVIDIGNTRIKTGVFNGSQLVRTDSYTGIKLVDLLPQINEHDVTSVMVSTVKKEAQPWLDELSTQLPVSHFDRTMASGIHNHYRTPHTLGLDRLAGVLGAMQMFPDSDRLIVDAGTCITYDGIDAQANYFGGSISPGLNMRYKALAHYTSVLPEVDPEPLFNNYYGDDTISAIRSGVQNGILHEVLGFIQRYKKEHTELNIILTGGDSVFLDTVLKNSIFAGYIKTEPHLVLIGLNAATHQHNDQI